MANPVPKYGDYWPTIAQRWDAMHLMEPDPHDPRPSKVTVLKAARRLLSNKARYQKIEEMTGVPWYMVAALHERESGANFDKQLAQGWSLKSKSQWIPRTGPFKTFEDSAFSALVTEKGFNKIVDWRLEKILYYSERYNGWGYYQYRGKMPSPYIWGATSVQTRGKYVADGQFDGREWDTQVGVAALIKALMELDDTIKPVRET